MKKQQKKQTGDFWFLPAKVGATAVGKFVAFTMGKFGRPNLMTDTFGVAVNPIIKDCLGQVKSKLKTGDEIKLIFTGTKDTGKANPLAVYRVFYKGKEIMPTGGTMKPLDINSVL